MMGYKTTDGNVITYKYKQIEICRLKSTEAQARGNKLDKKTQAQGSWNLQGPLYNNQIIFHIHDGV